MIPHWTKASAAGTQSGFIERNNIVLDCVDRPDRTNPAVLVDGMSRYWGVLASRFNGTAAIVPSVVAAAFRSGSSSPLNV